MASAAPTMGLYCRLFICRAAITCAVINLGENAIRLAMFEEYPAFIEGYFKFSEFEAIKISNFLKAVIFPTTLKGGR